MVTVVLAQDAAFDRIVGVLEEIIMEDAFRGQHERFCRENCRTLVVFVRVQLCGCECGRAWRCVCVSVSAMYWIACG